MSDKTKIEWTDATWNVINGCQVKSAGCKHCYAMRLAGTRMRHHPSRAGLTVDTKAGPVWNGEVKFIESELLKPLQWRKPRMIFVCAHGDLFYEAVPDEWIDRVFAVMALCPQHTFQVLTKRPERMREYLTAADVRQRIGRAAHVLLEQMARSSPPGVNWYADDDSILPWPLPSVWLGVSVEDQATADERIPVLLETPAALRWISAEPLLGPVDLTTVEPTYDAAGELTSFIQAIPDPTDPCDKNHIDWVVVGGESGPNSRPMHPDWARSLRDQCQAAGVPFLFKQWGSCLPCSWDGEDETGRTGCYIIDEEHSSVDYDVLGKGRPVSGSGGDFVRFHHKNTGRLLDGREWNEFPSRPQVEP
jgi:protein gp37